MMGRFFVLFFITGLFGTPVLAAERIVIFLTEKGVLHL